MPRQNKRVGAKGYASILRNAFGAYEGAVVEDARRMLRHRAGTSGEDLYAYDLDEGRRLGSVTTSTAFLSASPSRRMGRRTAAAVSKGHDVAMMHNHPCSSIPSAADINALKATGCRLGVIVAHDGTIYTYELVGEPAPGYTLTKDKFQAAFESRLDDEAKAYEALEQLFGVRIVHRAPSGRGV